MDEPDFQAQREHEDDDVEVQRTLDEIDTQMRQWKKVQNLLRFPAK